MGIAFTAEQQKVIDTHGCNLLVSAAAGSGKTAVLVERIVKMVSDGAHPTDIDRLLIVTFTNAAAAEMRERIREAIGAKLTETPENEHLQRQMTLLHNAQITTIDSFCLFVIRNHFHTIGLEPGFRIADEGELKLLKNDVLGDVLEQCYRKEEASFLHCMEYFSTGSRDKAVEEAILKLYDFAMSNPFPEDWLRERKKDYVIPTAQSQVNEEDNLLSGQTQSQADEEDNLLSGQAQSQADEEDSSSSGQAQSLMQVKWMQELFTQTNLSLQGLAERIDLCIRLCEEPDGPYMYGKLLEEEKEQIERLLAAQTYEERYRVFNMLTFGRLPSKKDETVSVMKRELVKSIRAEVKEQLQEMQESCFARSAEEIVKQMRVCGEAVCALVDVTILFQDTFSKRKREKNILDFDDIEHFALSILLRQKEDGSVAATETALEYRSYFEEILIDEYQDSNLVQEYLLSAISGEEEGHFNRFMVGDVKQSIYKFRLARPELFLEKYNAYEENAGNAMRIDLHKNFRSREQILISTNAVFSQIMTRRPGGIVYDEKAALYPGVSYPEYPMQEEKADNERKDTEIEPCGTGNGTKIKTEETGNDTEILLIAEQEKEIEKAENRKNDADSHTDRKKKERTEQQKKTISARKQEAYGIARKIKHLITSFQVTDKETGMLRKASFKDIVILLRTTAGWDEEFKEVLEEEGIPVHITSKTGYFASTEIRELLHFLRILDNPLQDIPFYGALHSYFGGFSEEETATVKAAFPKKKYLYDAAVEYAEKGEDESLGQRLRAFLEKMEKYREMTVYMPVHELLQTIIREYSYLSYAAAKPGGGRRRANVEMLLVKAADYEKTSYYGLYHFLRYIEQLEKYDVDYGEANLQDENADVVRIMSIHKSKGLEFPVCIVAGLAKNFNNRDTSDRLVMDVELGIGVDYVNPEMRIRSRNLRRNFIAAKLRQDNLAEEFRILYVAMTRAKEKLILTGVVKRSEKKMASLMQLQRREERTFSCDMLLRMGSFLDVLLSAVSRNQCFDEVWRAYGIEPNRENPLYQEEMNMRISVLDWEDILGGEIKEAVELENNRRRLLLFSASEDNMDKKLMTIMSEKFSWKYPYGNLKDLYAKTTVSELKKAGMREEAEFSFSLYEEEPIVPYLPKFIKQEETVSGAGRGSAFHKVMELFDFRKLAVAGGNTEELVKAELKRMLAEEKLSQDYYEAVSVPKIALFLQSGTAKRMAAAAAAGKLYKEQPFVLGLPANRLNETFPEQETVLIQGIIDAFFEEKGTYVVVDYKTDAVKTAEELVSRYQTQLDYYAEALEQLSGGGQTGKGIRTAEKIIYSFKLGEEIWLN